MKVKEFIDFYILGKYHCDKCPYCWSEWSYEGDGDAGCYIFDELRDTCRCLPLLRFILGWPKKKQTEYFRNHEYDGYGEYAAKAEMKQRLLEKLFREMMEDYEIYWKGDPKDNREPLDLSTDLVMDIELYRLCEKYEEGAHPVEHKKLSQEWKDLLQKTWNRFIGIFKPYFCK